MGIHRALPRKKIRHGPSRRRYANASPAVYEKPNNSFAQPHVKKLSRMLSLLRDDETAAETLVNSVSAVLSTNNNKKGNTQNDWG